jgi:alkanesulfonate monooxygenase SsuD/methylene tetrahydromethanopterin reductase-like flavin-dependent oxidoreductase (luciferase family)
LETEHLAYGIAFPPTRERFERLEEQLEILTGLWSAAPGESFQFSGRHYSLGTGPALPKPLQRPHPPVIVGGLGTRRTPALAARFAAEFNVPFADAQTTRARFEGVRDACSAAGRDPDELVYSHAITVCCAEGQADLERRAARIGRELSDLRENAAAGTPVEVAERLRAYRDAGASRSYLQVIDIDDLDQVALIAAEVMPLVDAV